MRAPKSRFFVETPDGPIVRLSVHVEGDQVICTVDPGVPHFRADVPTLQALARAMKAMAGTALDLRADVCERIEATGLIHNLKNPEGRLPVLPAMLPAPASARYARKRRSA